MFHCWAGISRSTAAAYIAACALAPDRDEAALALVAAGGLPSATPNARLVALADDLLGRQGRMVDAIRAIGRGCEAMEGTPFMLQLNALGFKARALRPEETDRWKSPRPYDVEILILLALLVLSIPVCAIAGLVLGSLCTRQAR